MSDMIEFPEMRSDVEDALTAFADRVIQARWGEYDAARNYYDDLTMNVNIMYDCHVFPDPSIAVDAVITEGEAVELAALWAAFKPILDDLGDQSDQAYTSDPRWRRVIWAAVRALAVMKETDQGTPM